MDWFTAPVAIDAASAAVIAAGMKAVALADGHLHEREVALIEEFASQVPPQFAQTGSEQLLSGEEVRSAFLRSLIFVALADGQITSEEHQVILSLAASQGYGAAEVDDHILQVKRAFLSVFSGVKVFRDSVTSVARDLGLSEAETEPLPS